jgi:uncharacterized protein YqkB
MPENEKNNESKYSLYSPIIAYKVDAMGKRVGHYDLTEKLFEVNEKGEIKIDNDGNLIRTKHTLSVERTEETADKAKGISTYKLILRDEKGKEIKKFDVGPENDVHIESLNHGIEGNQLGCLFSIDSLAKKLEESKKNIQFESATAQISFTQDSDSKNPKKVADSSLAVTVTATISSDSVNACVIINDGLNTKFYKSKVAEALLDAKNPEEALNKESKLGKHLQELATNKKESFSKQEAEYAVALLKELAKDGLTKEEKETFRTVASKLALTDSGTYKPTDLGIKVQNIGWNID